MVNKYLKGGKSEGMSLSQVAKLHQMNAEQLRPQLKKGIKHELEHTDNITDARRIALDHLVEFPDYYDRLDKIEKMHLGGDMSKHLAPNGKPSNLTHEQWHLVRTPEFKAWFGDWENDPKNASKVVDENGEPLLVYHGTMVETTFNVFDYDKADLGFHFGTKEQAKNRVESKGVLPSRKSIVNSFFLNIRVLFDMSDAGEWQYPQRYIDELTSDNIIEEKIAKQKGFFSLYAREDNALIRDYIKSKYGSAVGFVYNNKYEGKGKSFIALSPEQIKLADGSNTTFDSRNPDIRFDKGGLIAPNGNESNLTPEQYKLVRTKAFKDWFGDWENDPENASKVLDENGEPLVVYHGTKYTQEFNEFELDAISDENVKAFFFSKGYEHAKRYTFGTGSVKAFFLKAIKLFDPKSLSKSESIKIRSILDESVEDFIEYNYLDGLEEWKSKYDSNMSDEDFLFYILTQTDSSWQVVELEVFQDYLKSNNYNGFITYEQVTNQSTPNVNYAVFDANQIKLADGTNTTFDGGNPDIRFAKGGLIAPNGKESNLTPEQYKLVRSQAFKDWFGDWENDPKNASKVVDENGEPLVMYHGTAFGEFNEFDLNRIGRNYDQSFGFYFTNIKSKNTGYSAQEYANRKFISKKPYVFEVFLNIKNPILQEVFSERPAQAIDWERNELKAELRKGLKDGVIAESRWQKIKEVIAVTLNSEQIKLADGTNTTFDSNNPDIRFDKGGRTIAQTPAPKSDRVVGSKTNAKGSASDSELGKSIKFNDALEKAIQNKVDAYNEKNPSDKVSLSTAKAIVRRGMGAYSKSHRPFISGGAPNSRQAWGLARLNKFLLKKSGVKVKSAYIQDDDLLKYAQGGEVMNKNKDIRSNFNTMDKEVKHTMGKAGGYLVGRRHTEGGIKAINKATGQPLEMEGGEVVITRNAVSDGKTREFEGQMLTNREILSKINESGGGVSFEDGGEVMACGNQYNYGGTMMSDHDILHQMAVGGELDDMSDMEFEYGGEVSDFKLKNKIVFPVRTNEDFYYVNIFENPEDLQIFKATTYVRNSGRPVFKGFTKWAKGQFIMKSSYQYYDKKSFLTFIEPSASSAINIALFNGTPKKSMLIPIVPSIPNTKVMYDRFNTMLLDALTDAKTLASTQGEQVSLMITNPNFQNKVMEFFDEWAIQEPNFVYEEGVKKKVVRTKKEDKFQYGVESIKFGKSYDYEFKPYNNKLVKNDGNNSLVDLLSKLIKEYFSTDRNNPNAPYYEDRTLEIPVKELKLIQKNTGIDMSYGEGMYGMRNLEMITTNPSRNLLLNKKQQYGVPKLIIDNIENLGGANICFYLFDKMGYQYSNDAPTWEKWFKSGIIDFNLKLSLDDYCRVVGYTLARHCEEFHFLVIQPIYNISEEPKMIEDVKIVLDYDDSYLIQFQGTRWYDWLMVCVLYYRANYVSQTSKAKLSSDVRVAQNLKVGDKVEISEQEMNEVGFDGVDEKGDLLRGEVIGIRSVPAMKRPVNPEGNMYTIRYFVQDPVGFLQNDWEAKDLVLLEPSDVVQLEGEPTSTKKAPVAKNKKALGNLSELDKNIYDLQYLISITSDFDFEVKLQLRQQLTEFQKLKDIMYASENSEELMKTTTPNYDGKYAIAIIETMFNADSVELETRPNYALPKADGFQPNGSETLLSQVNYNLVQSSMFKEWFGDYLGAYDFKGLSGYDNIIPVSKVMTEGFEPLVVYQGLGRVFERQRFDSFPTSYFAVNPNYAEWFATTKGQRTQTDGYVLPFFLNIRNPLDFTYFGIDKVAPKDFFDYLFVKTGQTPEQLGFDARFLQPNVPPMEIWAYIRNSPNAITAIAKQGIYDGFHFFENNPQASGNQYQTEVWTTFFSSQAKLASDQRSKMLYSANQGFLMAKGGLVKK